MTLEGIFFDRPAARLAEVQEILGAICITEGVPVFNKWKDVSKRFIDAEGKYLEID
jgi:hypothetical protein